MRLDAERLSILALANKVVLSGASLAAARAAGGAAESAIKVKDLLLRQVSAQIGAEEESLLQRSAEALEFRAEVEAVALMCDGAPYDLCADQSVKRDYDRRRYESYERLAKAQELRLSSMVRLQTLRSNRSEAMLARGTAVGDKLKADHEISLLSIDLRRTTEEHAGRSAAYHRDVAVYDEVLPESDRDWKAMQMFASDLGFAIGG